MLFTYVIDQICLSFLVRPAHPYQNQHIAAISWEHYMFILVGFYWHVVQGAIALFIFDVWIFILLHVGLILYCTVSQDCKRRFLQEVSWRAHYLILLTSSKYSTISSFQIIIFCSIMDICGCLVFTLWFYFTLLPSSCCISPNFVASHIFLPVFSPLFLAIGLYLMGHLFLERLLHVTCHEAGSQCCTLLSLSS